MSGRDVCVSISLIVLLFSGSSSVADLSPGDAGATSGSGESAAIAAGEEVGSAIKTYPACWDYLTQCHGDSDNDGWVKGGDFLALKNSWYKCYSHAAYNPCADFDRDGCVYGADFLTLKSNWYKAADANCTGGDPHQIYPVMVQRLETRGK
ncbi:MAG: dockerin type I domain-containing protein [Planctomycetota bacterium]